MKNIRTDIIYTIDSIFHVIGLRKNQMIPKDNLCLIEEEDFSTNIVHL
jgi:hypothetical protein